MTTPMTPEGERRLREELAELKNVARPNIVREIAEARGHGDLRENAEYHAAKEQQGFIEGRIREVEGKLADAQVIDITRIGRTGRVVFGTTVTLEDCDSGETVRYQIVGEDEADLGVGKISFLSPIGRAMIGKSEEDSVVVTTPNGEREYVIDRVEHL
ncbi:MAG: transcription elongation factor GreA [Gammaproteobacteria bacterium]|nr:transcription elongation factor GreA [Gammaproteobacteria bacterium]